MKKNELLPSTTSPPKEGRTAVYHLNEILTRLSLVSIQERCLICVKGTIKTLMLIMFVWNLWWNHAYGLSGKVLEETKQTKKDFDLP